MAAMEASGEIWSRPRSNGITGEIALKSPEPGPGAASGLGARMLRQAVMMISSH